MAKTSMVERETKRAKLVKKYAARRAELKKAVANPKLSFDDRMEAQQKRHHHGPHIQHVHAHGEKNVAGRDYVQLLRRVG